MGRPTEVVSVHSLWSIYLRKVSIHTQRQVVPISPPCTWQTAWPQAVAPTHVHSGFLLPIFLEDSEHQGETLLPTALAICTEASGQIPK